MEQIPVSPATDILWQSVSCELIFFNRRKAIAWDVIGLLLIVYDSKRRIGFLKVFTTRSLLVLLRFLSTGTTLNTLFKQRSDLKAKVSKVAA